ncbi:Pumilio [Citrus sinensis]|uniref:Pumilio n=2 Tax=Citrus sinensis TaxID=2711 RepID=A0ACB8JAH6_CITSI|nr:Pumilio [Citrus sinensis]
MVAVGLKGLPSSRQRLCDLVEDSLMGGDDKSYKPGRKKKGLNRKAKKESFGFDADNSNKNSSGRGADGSASARKSWKHQNASDPKTSVVRKQVDPDLAKYFAEISNLFESNEVDLEERSVLCRNALEETRGKELELATDYIISHTLQTLLEGCDVDHLCSFLRGCAKVFPAIAMDRSGSHVAETALKSLAMHLQDEHAHSIIEETLKSICKVIVANPVDVMCNCYGSHVLRSLLCLCRGAPLDSSDFHRAKPSQILAERLNLDASQSNRNNLSYHHPVFSELSKFLISGILACSRKDLRTLQTDQYSSLVLQTALRLLVGNDPELLQIISILLGSNKDNVVEGNFIPMTVVHDVLNLMKETAYSHLMEVILEVAPQSLYDEMFTKVFRNSLFDLSSHHCANFVVQALVSHARDQDQMALIWEELGGKFRELLEMGRSGVVAALIAASQRLHTHERKCCEALAAAVSSTNVSPRCIVPGILFLESYFSCEDKSNWNWPKGIKIQIIGSLILQAVFRFPSEFIQPYVTSITSMEADHVLEAAKDAAGARVIEAYLSSKVSAKQKHRVVLKLKGHFGELSVHPSGSFTVERCFTASSLSLRETIASELSAVRNELSKTKQGPHLIRKLDIDGFTARPDQWRLKQSAKQLTYKEFYSTFGSNDTKSSRKDSFLADSSKQTSNSQGIKNMRKEIDNCLDSTALLSGKSGLKRRSEKEEHRSEKYAKHVMADDISKGKNKKKNKKNQVASEYAGPSSKGAEIAAKPFLSTDKTVKKRNRSNRPSKASKKLKP